MTIEYSPRDGCGGYLIDLLWGRRLLIALGFFIGGLLGIGLALVKAPVYRVQVTLVPAEGAAGVRGLLDQFGGLAALAGVPIGGADQTAEAIALLKSRAFTESLIQELDLLPRLYWKLWDEEASTWKAGVKPPSLWDGYRLFDRTVRRVHEDKKSGTVTVTLEWIDGEEAARWANVLVQKVNEQMKSRAISEAERAVAFLTQEAQATNVVAVQQAVASLIEAQLKESVFARVRNDYVFRVVDPAKAPDVDDPIRPKLIVHLIGGSLAGIFIVLSLLVMRDILAALRASELRRAVN